MRPTRSTVRTTHSAMRATPLLAALIGTVVLAGCGSSHKPSQSAAADPGIEFATCMRAHGVPNFPDPGGGGGGIQIPIGSGVNPAAPAFQQAQKSCRRLLPGGGSGPGQATAQEKQTMVRLAQCMRAHGVSGFPDPISSPPSSPVGFSIAFGRPGAFIAVPNTINVQAPAFKQAALKCGFPGFRP
jgi:hypothetical protein